MTSRSGKNYQIDAAYELTMADYRNKVPLSKIQETLKRAEQKEQFELCAGIKKAIDEIKTQAN